jgi:hypothetical protein
LAINTSLRHYPEEGPPEDIWTKPLPDADEKNAGIPVENWKLGIDGKPQKPWAHTVHVYFVDATSGETFTYSHNTIGAHVAFDALKSSVIAKRALYGDGLLPVIHLTETDFKTGYGMKKRPHLEIIDYKAPGGDAKAVSAPTAPQLPGPAEASPETPQPAAKSEQPKQSRRVKAKASAEAPKATGTDDGTPW